MGGGLPPPSTVSPRAPSLRQHGTLGGEMGGLHRRLPRGPGARLAGVHVRRGGHRDLPRDRDDRRADPSGRLVRALRRDRDRRLGRLPDGHALLPRPASVRDMVRPSAVVVLRRARPPAAVPPHARRPLGVLDPVPRGPRRRGGRRSRDREPDRLQQPDHGAGVLRQEPDLLDRRERRRRPRSTSWSSATGS